MSPDLERWVCPKCQTTIHAIATQVSHKCGSNKSQPTNFVREVK